MTNKERFLAGHPFSAFSGAGGSMSYEDGAVYRSKSQVFFALAKIRNSSFTLVFWLLNKRIAVNTKFSDLKFINHEQ